MFNLFTTKIDASKAVDEVTKFKIPVDIHIEHIKENPVFALGDCVCGPYPINRISTVVKIIEMPEICKYLVENSHGERRWIYADNIECMMRADPFLVVVKGQTIINYKYLVEYQNEEREIKSASEVCRPEQSVTTEPPSV